MKNLQVVILPLALWSTAVGQNPQPAFTIQDAATLHSASAVAVSPDGNSLLYRVQLGAEKGPEKTEWHLIPVAGGESRRVEVPEQFKAAGFTRDGSALYGLYEVNKQPQLALFPLAAPNTPAAAAATPVPLTSLPRGLVPHTSRPMAHIMC